MSVGDFADGELGDERCVAGKNSEIAVAARNLDFFCAVLYDQALRSDDFEFDSVCHEDVLGSPRTGLARHGPRGVPDVPYAFAFICSAASRTSSIEPFM